MKTSPDGRAPALARDEAVAYVAAGLCLGRVLGAGAADEDARPRQGEGAALVSRDAVGSWILATLVERLELPPVSVIGDLGGLLFGVPLRVGGSVPCDDPALAAAIRRYEDAVLGRLAVSTRLASAGFAVARLPPEMHAQAVGILVSGVLARIDFDVGVEIQPGIVRLLTERTPLETMQRGYATLRDDAAVRKRLTEGYAALARAAQKARELIGDADLFALENLVVLGSLTQRLAIVDVVRAQEALATSIPRRVARRRRQEGDVMSKLEDESVYPVGGFASVSTSGSLENLVTSELIYMDPPPPKGAPRSADVDLFDMRYVEGELLYYTRDEAIFVRRRRLVLVLLSPSLVRTRIKDRTLPYQRIMLVLGLVLVLVKKLVELLGEEALLIRVVFVQDEDGTPTPLAEEKALTELMLGEWRDRGRCEVAEEPWARIASEAMVASRRSLVEVVRIDANAPGELPAWGPKVVVVDFVPPANASIDEWSQRTTDVLSALL